MNKFKSKKEGGYVVQREEIEAILKTPKTVGIAFGVAKPGYAPDVNLKVYRVYEDSNQLVGEEVKIEKEQGAASVNAPSSSCADYVFEYVDKLETNGFDFAYLTQHEYAALFKNVNSEHELFIAGGIRDYGSQNEIDGKWFTLTIAPRDTKSFDANESLKFMQNPPRFKFMDGCPPIWDAFPPDGNENFSLATKIKFQKSVHA